MFSGFGISADGTNFALALRAGLYFRADEQTIPQFEAEGSKPFQYQTRAKTVTVNSYWQLPARLYRRSGRSERVGEGGPGGRPARGVAEAAEGEEGGEDQRLSAKKKAAKRKKSVILRSRASARRLEGWPRAPCSLMVRDAQALLTMRL